MRLLWMLLLALLVMLPCSLVSHSQVPDIMRRCSTIGATLLKGLLG